MWLLMDHPDKHEFVSGVDMNFGQAGLLLLQRYSKLIEGSKALEKQGYYDSWSNAEKQFVFKRNSKAV